MADEVVCLAISGSDPSGGAGLQADLKTFAALNVYGAAVVSALTAQNTRGVSATAAIPPDFLKAQLTAVLDDLPVAAIKTGMLGDAATVAATVEVLGPYLDAHPEVRLVVDPVMVSRSGDELLDFKAVGLLRAELMPLATVVTPNRLEAARLTGLDPFEDVAGLRRTAFALFELVGKPVLVKGGAALQGALDLLIDGHGNEFPIALADAPIASRSTHGTGCTLSAALTALLGKGHSLREAASGAKQFVFGAIRHAPGLGAGAYGPLDHNWLRRHVPGVHDHGHGAGL